MNLSPSSNAAQVPQALDLASFDRASGSWVERGLFNHRGWVIAVCLLLTLLLGWQATHLRLSASFEKTIPTSQPFVVNFLAHQHELQGLGNAVRIAVANPKGSIYDAAYMELLRGLNDELFLLPGVARQGMKSLWTPSTRWTGVTEEGLEGGPVIPDGWDGGAESLQKLQANIARSGEIGQLVALDAQSSVIFVPLLSKTPDGQALDYAAFAGQLERLRAKYEAREIGRASCRERVS
jgi:predicted RND superfamily exporter protein